MESAVSASFENIFCKQKTDFHRGFNAQHCLLVIYEKFRKALDKGGDNMVLLIIAGLHA